MRFRSPRTTQDVIVSCCILHNIYKHFQKKDKKYTELEKMRVIRLCDDVQQLPQHHRLQNWIVQNYFD